MTSGSTVSAMPMTVFADGDTTEPPAVEEPPVVEVPTLEAGDGYYAYVDADAYVEGLRLDTNYKLSSANKYYTTFDIRYDVVDGSINGFRSYSYHNLSGKTAHYGVGNSLNSALAAGQWHTITTKSVPFAGVDDTNYFFVLHNMYNPTGYDDAPFAPFAFDNFKLWQVGVDGADDTLVFAEDFEPTSARAGAWTAYNGDDGPDCTLTWQTDGETLTVPETPAGGCVGLYDRTTST